MICGTTYYTNILSAYELCGTNCRRFTNIMAATFDHSAEIMATALDALLVQASCSYHHNYINMLEEMDNG